MRALNSVLGAGLIFVALTSAALAISKQPDHPLSRPPEGLRDEDYAGDALTMMARIKSSPRRDCDRQLLTALEEQAIQDFCAHPYRTACVQTRALEDREALTAEMNRQLSAEAQGLVARGQEPTFLEAYRRALKTKLGASDHPWRAKDREELLRTMVRAVETHPHLTVPQRHKLARRIEGLRIVDAFEILDQRPPDEGLVRKVAHQCGLKGIRSNAFNPPDSNLLVICPGLVAVERELQAKRGISVEVWPQLVLALAHETGHLMDSTTFPIEHRNFAACMRGAFPREFDDDAMEELSADAWAAEGLAQVASAEPDRAAVLHRVIEATKTFCMPPPKTDRYLSGEARLDFIVGRNPRLRRALGCAPLPDPQFGCALEGRAPRVPTKKREPGDSFSLF